MVKKWVFAAIAYLVIVMLAFGIYNSTVEPDPMSDNQEEIHGGNMGE